MPESIIPSDAVQAIKDSVETKIIEVDGYEFTTRQVFWTPTAGLPKKVELYTLSGLADFVNTFQEPDNLDFVHVDGHDKVELIGKMMGRNNERPVYADVTLPMSVTDHAFTFNHYISAEDFVIGLQTGFMDVGDRAAILKIVGNLKAEKMQSVSDDGISQRVQVSHGVYSSMMETADVPNPVSLAPWRTFAEIDQPITKFILRLQQGSREGSLPTVGLFTTNDAGWELVAINSIKVFLGRSIDNIPIIG